ncbi:MAG: HAD hydrolase family protein [Candidatus Neomarinimicrobiota bacterium]
MTFHLKKAAGKIKIILSDLDGVFTDGTIYKGSDGIELKRFSVLDAAGVALVRAAGIRMAIISGRYSPATDVRVMEMGLEKDCYQGNLNKMDAYYELRSKYDFSDEEAAFIGDDIIDLTIMETVGLPIAVANAHPRAKQIAKYTTQARGGEGAVREAVEMILESKGIYESALERVRQRTSDGKDDLVHDE